jgi:hypothetical protein
MIRVFLIVVLVSLIALTSNAGPAQVGEKDEDLRRATKAVFRETKEAMEGEEYDKVHKFLSVHYFKDYGETRDRVDRRWRRRKMLDLDFTINRILTSQEGYLNVQVSWREKYLDAKGRPQKANGQSEIILKPTRRGSYKILDVKGDQFF